MKLQFGEFCNKSVDRIPEILNILNNHLKLYAENKIKLDMHYYLLPIINFCRFLLSKLF